MRASIGLICLLPTIGWFVVGHPLQGQVRVGQLTAVTGSVTITRAEDGTVAEVRQVGPRVRNGSLFAGDELRTEADSGATLAFSDGSEVRVAESTGMVIHETEEMSEPTDGSPQRAAGRTIRVLVGKVWADMVPSQTVVTRFETPSGVAAIKGTKLAIEVVPDP